MDREWALQAACAGMDTEIWFIESEAAHDLAKSICVRCPVQEACLQAAIEIPGTFGVWGGKTKRQRTRMAAVPRQRTKREVAPGGMAAINAAKTHCKNNHPFDDENTGWNGTKRYCKKCQRERSQRARQLQRKGRAAA